MGYIFHIAITACYFIILVLSLNIAMGYTGLLNLGHVAFFGVGAYTSAILTTKGLSFEIALLSAALVAAGFGYLLTLVTRRLQGDYLALATLGFSFVVYSLFLNWKSLTRGPLGIVGIKRPDGFGWEITSNGMYLLFVFLLTCLIVFLVHRLLSSRYGRLLEAVRDDKIGLVMLGKNVSRLSAQAMMISAGLAGVAGSLFSHHIRYIHPSNFFLSDIILLLCMLIVGGLASVRGSVAGAVFFVMLAEAIRFLPIPPSIFGPARLIMYGLILILILLYRPKGLFGRVDLR